MLQSLAIAALTLLIKKNLIIKTTPLHFFSMQKQTTLFNDDAILLRFSMNP